MPVLIIDVKIVSVIGTTKFYSGEIYLTSVEDVQPFSAQCFAEELFFESGGDDQPDGITLSTNGSFEVIATSSDPSIIYMRSGARGCS
ncbi:MAG: hypothetical protein ACI845_000769 [Gammaproteobacteria bacterium]|jgi:hypothetical protein